MAKKKKNLEKMKLQSCPPASSCTAVKQQTLKQPSDSLDVVTVLSWAASALPKDAHWLTWCCVCVCSTTSSRVSNNESMNYFIKRKISVNHWSCWNICWFHLLKHYDVLLFLVMVFMVSGQVGCVKTECFFMLQLSGCSGGNVWFCLVTTLHLCIWKCLQVRCPQKYPQLRLELPLVHLAASLACKRHQLPLNLLLRQGTDKQKIWTCYTSFGTHVIIGCYCVLH